MAGAGGKEVGRVSIRVVPDLDRFREELKAELEKFEKETLKIKASVDTSGIRQEIAAASKNLPDAEVKVRADDSELNSLSDKIKNSTRKAKVGVAVEPDVKSKASFTAKLKEFLAGVGRGLRGNAGVIKVPVEVDLERRGLGRSIRSFVSAIRGAFSNAAATARSGLDALVSSFGGLSRALSRFSPESIIQAIAIIGAVAALAAPAIALLSGALLTLPAALAGILVPIGVVALGLDGIKKAAETAKPAFEELKKAVSDTFENGLKPGFELIRDRLLPGLTEPLKGVASSLSTAFNSVIGTLSSPPGLNNLQRTVDNIGAAIRAAVPGLQSFTNGLTSLIANVTAKFPNLSESFNNVGKDFDNWIAKITSNGQLDTALDTLGGTLSEIGGTIKDIAQWGFDNLADPAFGAQLKGFAQDLRALVNETLPLLKSGFQDVATVVSGIRDTINAIKSVSDTFAKLTGVQENLSKGPKQTEGFLGLFGKDGVLGDNAPFRKFFGEAPKAAAEAGSEAAKQFSQNLNQAASSAGDNGAALTSAINSQLTAAVNVSKEAQANALRSAFTGTGVTDAVKNQIGTQMTGIITEAQAAVSRLGPVLQQGIDQAVLPLSTLPAKVGQAFGTLAPAITGAWSVIQQTVTAGVTQLNTAISTAFQQLPLTATTAFQGVQASITGAFGFMVLSIGQQAGNITTAVQQAFNQIPAVITSALGQAVSAVAAAGSQITTAFQASIGQLPTLAQTSFAALVTSAQTAMNDLVSAVTNGGSQAVAAVQGWSGQITSALQSLSASARASGEAVGREFAGGISSQSGAVAAAAQSLMQAARQFFPNSPAEKGPFSGSGWVDKSGEAIGQGFSAGMESSVGGVVEIARVMMQQVKDVFGDASGVVFNFNFNQVAQPISQFSSGIAGLGTAMSGVLPAASEFKTTMGEAGQSLALLDLPQSKGRIEELKKSLLELEIQRKSLEAARDMPGADQAAIKAQIEQIRNQKNLLGLERDKLTYAQKYGGQMSSTAQSYKEQMNSLQQIPFDFATATSSQFMSDLGWSGQGAIPSLMQQGMDFGTNFIFNVANMDDALSGQRVLQNRTAQATLGR